MDLAAARTKVMGFGMQLLDGIDPNPDNFVCAGIIHARSSQIGCLLRLEPNKQAQVIWNSIGLLVSIYVFKSGAIETQAYIGLQIIFRAFMC